MMNTAFRETTKNLGTIKAKKTIKVSFDYVGDLSITSILTSCGCSKATWDKESRKIDVDYTPQEVPYHFIQQKRTSYESKKDVTVVLDNSTVVLTFTATVIA